MYLAKKKVVIEVSIRVQKSLTSMMHRVQIWRWKFHFLKEGYKTFHTNLLVQNICFHELTNPDSNLSRDCWKISLEAKSPQQEGSPKDRPFHFQRPLLQDWHVPDLEWANSVQNWRPLTVVGSSCAYKKQVKYKYHSSIWYSHKHVYRFCNCMWRHSYTPFMWSRGKKRQQQQQQPLLSNKTYSLF